MTTTTLAAIIARQTALIEALTPTALRGDPFRRSPRRHLLRDWADANPGSACLRKFEIRRTGVAVDAPFMDTSSVERNEEVNILVAYPVLPDLYGQTELDALEDVMRSDARQIRDAIFSSGNYLAGQTAAFVTIQSPDRSSPDVWFSELVVDVHYYEAQSL